MRLQIGLAGAVSATLLTAACGQGSEPVMPKQPDLNTQAVMAWLDQKEPGLPAVLRHAIRAIERDDAVDAGLVRLGTSLDHSRERNPAGLSARLVSDPGRDDLRSILAQLGGCRVLRTLDWLTEPEIPQRRALIAALLEPDGTGAGHTLQTTIQQLNRRILIGRMTAEMWTLRQMSLSIMGKLAAGEDPAPAAAIVKDLGTSLEQDMPRAIQALSREDVELGGNAAFAETLPIFCRSRRPSRSAAARARFCAAS